MDTEVILITKEGPIVKGIGSGESTDFIRIPSSELPGIKAFCIGFLPESVLGKRIGIYVEDEQVYKKMAMNWKD